MSNIMKVKGSWISIPFALLYFNSSLASKEWDSIIFTQEWGETSCREFKDGPKHIEKCRYEDKPSIWSIHGVWPSKTGTKGPAFCTKVKFDVEALDPIVQQLNQAWYEIDAKQDAHKFWEHEWLKHGSCAMELDEFGSEIKYFQKALEFHGKFDIYSILKSGGGIIPSQTQGYKLEDIHVAFQNSLGSQHAKPYVQCLKVKNATTFADEYHILAIELCLDKKLELMDCRSKKLGSPGLYSDQSLPCPANGEIFYKDYNLKKTLISDEL